MSFDRERLPDPVEYYHAQGLRLEGKGKWRTTACLFHGGSDSMRLNTASGGYCCMACGASGGDVLAYEIAATGSDFVTAAKTLGAWIEDGKPAPRRSTPLPARDALHLLAAESNLAAVAAANVAYGVTLTQTDRERLLAAAGRIAKIAEVFA